MRVTFSAPDAHDTVSPVDTVFDAVSAVQSVRCVPPVDAEKIAKCVIVPDPDAAADVNAVPFAFTDGSADVAAAHPVAPTLVRARIAASLVPFVEYAT